MEDQGFVNYNKEWWHYTFQPEPFPDTYFDSRPEFAALKRRTTSCIVAVYDWATPLRRRY